ncbi:MAG: type II CAAX prenyl endopeptidase Rce1 family protein [Anaerolineales bacterium]
MMKNRLRALLGQSLNIDWKIALLTIVSTLLITVDYYFRITPGNYYDSILLYIVIPLGITWLIFRESPADYGFVIGDWKTGLLITVGGILLMAPIIWYLGTHQTSMQQYYQYQPQGLIWKKGLELFGWEYLFRGWLLFGYARKYGPDALWLQAVPFAVAHIGKPAVETLSTIFGGFAFGWVSWRTGSFLYAFLIHWFISAFIILISSGALG